MTADEPAAPDVASREVDPDFQASIDAGLTETFEDYCKRTSKETP